VSDDLMISSSRLPQEWSGITFNTGPGRVVLRITSDGKLEKAEGYSTEEAAQVIFDAVSGHIDGIWKKVRDENAALREELESVKRKWESDRRFMAGAFELLARQGAMPSSRQLIEAADDAARKEAQS
jgi:hypothetical protein